MSDLIQRINAAQVRAGEAAVMAHLAEQGLIPAKPTEATPDAMRGVEAVKRWFDLAVPTPTDKNRAVQLGCHFEEVSEMLDAVDHGDEATRMSLLGDRYKKITEVAIDDLEHREKVDLLDALCDQIVTAVGVAHMFGFDILGALAEVNRSNFSKFVDGKPVFNEHGKIAKPTTFSPADVTPFIGK